MVSIIIALLIAALATTALVLDYYSPQTPGTFHFPAFIFPMCYNFQPDTRSVTGIISVLLSFGNYCAVPYVLTIMRISIDQYLSKSDRALSILALVVVVGCQIIVFVSSVVYMSRHAIELEATIILLLLCTGIVTLRGVAYSMYVLCVVNRQIEKGGEGGLL